MGVGFFLTEPEVHPMLSFLHLVDKISTKVGHLFAWTIVLLTGVIVFKEIILSHRYQDTYMNLSFASL